MPKNASTRRHFMAAASAAALAAPAVARSATVTSSALEGLNIACIGTANRAAADISGVIGENIVALCDVDAKYLSRMAKQIEEKNGTAPRQYADYRELIDAEGDKIDAVVVATTDHHHAPATIRAIRAGKHVYCEKPLTHTVEEARIITNEAKKAGVATQMGTQIHAGSNYRRVVELIRSGAIGDVNEVHVWVGKVWGGGDKPTTSDPAPEHLDWDLWLGPAEERPYASGAYHPANWRRHWAFGQGTLGDMACHYMDLPFWALELKYPTHCVATGPEVHPDTCPVGLKVEYQYPGKDGGKPISLTWYDGNMIPKTVAGERVPQSGVMFVGSEGHMLAGYSNYVLFPRDKYQGFEPPAPSIPDSIGHHAEWIKACKDGSPTTCHFGYSGPLTEAVLLGNVAYRTGKPIAWDAENLTATNNADAAALLTKSYRAGWEVKA